MGKFRHLFEILLLASCWGPSFLFIKLGVEEFTPIMLVGCRLALAASLMYTLLKIRRLKLPPWGKIWGHLAVWGFFSASLPFLLFAIGEMRVTSAMAGVLNGLTPLAAAPLAHMLLPGERLSPSRIVGILIGVTGFGCILYPHIADGHLSGSDWGIIAIAVASISYAVGMVYARKFIRGLPRFTGPAGMLLITASYMFPIALISNIFVPSAPITLQGFGALSGLALLGTVGAFYFYYRILEHSGAGIVALATYLLPVYGTVLGAIFLGEHLRWTTYASGGLILLGMMIVKGTIPVPFLSAPKSASS